MLHPLHRGNPQKMQAAGEDPGRRIGEEETEPD